LLNVARAEGADSTLLEALLDHNRGRHAWITRQLREHVFSHAARPAIALWGLTYKKDTTSTKNSPALRLISELEGKCDFRAWDPAVDRLADHPEVRLAADGPSALDGADALLIMADWDVFAEADVAEVRRRLRTPLVIDCAGVWRSIRGPLDGIQYLSMGQPGSGAA
jgi:UDPglucose 6-dehydrogenase